MQKKLDLIIVSTKKSFANHVLDFCKEHNIIAKSFDEMPVNIDEKALVLLDVDSIGEGCLENIKNTVICLTSHFESKDNLMKLLRSGAMTVKSFRMPSITTTLTSYYKRA